MSTNAANNEKISRSSCLIINVALRDQHENTSNIVEELLYKSPLRTGIRPSKSDYEEVKRLREKIHKLEIASFELETICKIME